MVQMRKCEFQSIASEIVDDLLAASILMEIIRNVDASGVRGEVNEKFNTVVGRCRLHASTLSAHLAIAKPKRNSTRGN